MTFLGLPKPAVIAHRGGRKYAPDNTLAAFEIAVRQGVDAIELDVQLCGSGEIVVIHDQTVDCTAQDKCRVKQTSLTALKELDIGSRFDAAFQGERIPTLEEVFEVVGKKIKINIELKNFASPFDDLPLKVAELVKHQNLIGQVFFSSFFPWVLTRAHRLVPEVPICLLLQKGWAGGFLPRLVSSMIHSSALHPEVTDVTHQYVERAHQRGVYVNAWTVNDPDDMQRLMVDGVDGIISDDPVLALQMRSSIQKSNLSTG